MNKIKITDLRIGDIVCNPRTKFPMRVVAVFEDGTVYLDFDGREGDVFEENCKDLEFVEEHQKPEKVKYDKCFYNEGTKKIYKTLSAARSACKSSHIYRCWALGDEVKCLSQITCYSEQFCTIKQADEKISKAIKNGTVGVGFRDKRMC